MATRNSKEILNRFNMLKIFFDFKNWTEFAVFFGTNVDKLYTYRTGKANLPIDFLNILEANGISKDWIQYGKGKMLLIDNVEEDTNEVEFNTFNERLSYLIKKKYHNKNTIFADNLNISKATISRWLNSEKMPNLQVELLDKLREKNINTEWLNNGKGKMLLSDNVQVTSNAGVPYYPLDVTASIITAYDDIPEVPEYYIDFKPMNDCVAYFPVHGDSMYPKFCAGDIIGVKKHNLTHILWGEAYVVLTTSEANSMRTIKLLYPHSDDDKLILRASNPNYLGDTVIEKKYINAIYLVKGKLHISQL